jgi:hypothetical protein
MLNKQGGRTGTGSPALLVLSLLCALSLCEELQKTRKRTLGLQPKDAWSFLSRG